MQKYDWSILSFDELDKLQLLALLQLRQEVFMLEQNSLYLDIDDADPGCHHLLMTEQGELRGYARLTPPGVCHSKYPVLGRIVLAKEARGGGTGKVLIEKGLDWLHRHFPKQSIKISAQEALVDYYQHFGFEVVSEPYDDGGVMHLDMLLAPEDYQA
ncbi:GNAT family N-acetyltransferase [Corallincola platygyrae]|uniref:GNAT family N-acetyltransferase n=1 Tax=Corallincola platygyrae TaxID=1193278 RepID=A0ABW4XTZ9_9GAMM